VLHLTLGVVIAAIAITVAVVVSRRTNHRGDGADPVIAYGVPAMLDRNDFVRPDAPWLVAAFSSSTCLSCADAWDKVQLLESDDVAVQEVEAIERRDLHQRYGIEAVPMVLVADEDGDVRASFIGPPTAADLWAVVAELREPGSTPTACDHHQSAP
jgi:hypothetical protein